MRVISGSAGGLVLTAPKGHKVRPTADRVRESVFNILASRLPLVDVDILDLFAGTGALGIEALSRGARSAMFIDASPDAQRAIRSNLSTTKLRHRAAPRRVSALKGIAIAEDQGCRFGGVFLDPPYGEGWIDKVLRRLARSPILLPGAWVVAEHTSHEAGADTYAPLVLTDRRRYGTTGVSFYLHEGEGCGGHERDRALIALAERNEQPTADDVDVSGVKDNERPLVATPRHISPNLSSISAQTSSVTSET